MVLHNSGSPQLWFEKGLNRKGEQITSSFCKMSKFCFAFLLKLPVKGTHLSSFWHTRHTHPLRSEVSAATCWLANTSTIQTPLQKNHQKPSFFSRTACWEWTSSSCGLARRTRSSTSLTPGACPATSSWRSIATRWRGWPWRSVPTSTGDLIWGYK